MHVPYKTQYIVYLYRLSHNQAFTLWSNDLVFTSDVVLAVAYVVAVAMVEIHGNKWPWPSPKLMFMALLFSSGLSLNRILM